MKGVAGDIHLLSRKQAMKNSSCTKPYFDLQNPPFVNLPFVARVWRVCHGVDPNQVLPI
jgi:hypothetical protein